MAGLGAAEQYILYPTSNFLRACSKSTRKVAEWSALPQPKIHLPGKSDLLITSYQITVFA